MPNFFLITSLIRWHKPKDVKNIGIGKSESRILNVMSLSGYAGSSFAVTALLGGTVARKDPAPISRSCASYNNNTSHLINNRWGYYEYFFLPAHPIKNIVSHWEDIHPILMANISKQITPLTYPYPLMISLAPCKSLFPGRPHYYYQFRHIVLHLSGYISKLTFKWYM